MVVVFIQCHHSLRIELSCGYLLAQLGLLDHGLFAYIVLVGHASAQSSLDLGAQADLAHVVFLLLSGHKSLG